MPKKPIVFPQVGEDFDEVFETLISQEKKVEEVKKEIEKNKEELEKVNKKVQKRKSK